MPTRHERSGAKGRIAHTVVQAPPAFALARIASTMRLARHAVLECRERRRMRRRRDLAGGDELVDVAHHVAEGVGPAFLMPARQARVAARAGRPPVTDPWQHLVGAMAAADPELVLLLLSPATDPGRRRLRTSRSFLCPAQTWPTDRLPVAPLSNRRSTRREILGRPRHRLARPRRLPRSNASVDAAGLRLATTVANRRAPRRSVAR